MKYIQQRSQRNHLTYVLHPIFRCGEKGGTVIHFTGMVWSGGISAAAPAHIQFGIRR